MFFGSVLIISRPIAKVSSKCLHYFPAAYWRSKELLQHGGSILGSIILRGTFRRIAQLWESAHPLNLVNCLLYLSSIILQFLDLIHWMVFNFIFYYVTVHTLYYPERCCTNRGNIASSLEWIARSPGPQALFRWMGRFGFEYSATFT